MNAPRILDLFCGEGGAAMGYHRAGFEVVGVDINPRALRRYPFETIHADALDVLADSRFVAGFDAVHASAPCQAYSVTRHTHGHIHPDLIDPVREGLVAAGLPYVIENVPGAPLRDPLLLCGSMFDLGAIDTDGTRLRLQRHRLFESNVFLFGPGTACRHDTQVEVGGVYGGGSSPRRPGSGHGGYSPGKHTAARLIGADWMTLRGLAQSIPPAYTDFVGSQLLDRLGISSLDGAA
ncbi:DNA cytosine methyltransferase [Nocardioides luteus]|uniref:Uncharacterized protein n=1 Tax=Nocardioides luteus TaxID=1844 RepID=A0A1J4N113_9ACTN|nr:DNA cytosine methyltransferase [Nocardioides luteus]OIJ25227.1 hypothetical protein UG56_018505 [Nocardioides luteus]